MSSKKHTFIISAKPGQLGNMLVLFSHFIVFAIEKKNSIKAPAFHAYAHYFKTTENSLVPSFPEAHSVFSGKQFRHFTYRIANYFARSINRLQLNNRLFASKSIDWHETITLHENNLPDSRYIFVMGWIYRSDTLIQKHKKSIVDFFKPLDSYLLNIGRLLPKDGEVLIGVHIRHGDYKTFEGGKYFFNISQYIYLMKRAMALMPGKKVKFLICSNIELNQKDFDEVPFFFGTGKEIEDLYAFTKCHYLIGPPSTYTIWASFYGDVPLYQVHDPRKKFGLENFSVAKI